jgi:hypothetical protein
MRPASCRRATDKNHSIGFEKALDAANLAIRTDRIYLSTTTASWGLVQILSAMGAVRVSFITQSALLMAFNGN